MSFFIVSVFFRQVFVKLDIFFLQQWKGIGHCITCVQGFSQPPVRPPIGRAEDWELLKWTGKCDLDRCQELAYPSTHTLPPLVGNVPEVNL